MKVGRVAIITRGRYAGKKVRQDPHPPRAYEKKEERDGRQDEGFFMDERTTHWKNEDAENFRMLTKHFFCESTGRHCPA